MNTKKAKELRKGIINSIQYLFNNNLGWIIRVRLMLNDYHLSFVRGYNICQSHHEKFTVKLVLKYIWHYFAVSYRSMYMQNITSNFDTKKSVQFSRRYLNKFINAF